MPQFFQAYITNVSQCNHTLINDSPLAGEEVCILGHKDIITIADRQFRWEYPEGSVLAVSVKRDQVINYKILSPSTKSRDGLHNLNGGQYMFHVYFILKLLHSFV